MLNYKIKIFKSKFYLIVSFFLIVIIIYSCSGGKDIKPSSPDVKVDTANFIKSSTISIPFEINLKPAFDVAESQFPKSFGAPKWNEQFGTGGADACPNGVSCEYSVTRTPLSFTMNANILTTSLAVGYGLNCRFRVPCSMGALISAGCGPSHAHGSWSTRINLDNSWNSNIHSVNNGVIPDDDCNVGPFGGIVNITNKVMGGFNVAFDKVGQTLDAKIIENLKSKERISEAW